MAAARELADKTAPDYGDAFAQRSSGQPDAVQRDRGDRRQGRMLERDGRRHPRTEIGWHGNDLRVVCETGACASDPVARGESVDSRPDADHLPCRAVADRALLCEPALDGGAGFPDAFGSGASGDLANEVRPFSGARDKRLLRLRDAAPFGPGANGRELVSDDYGSPGAVGLGNVPNNHEPASVLKHLLHLAPLFAFLRSSAIAYARS